MKETGWTGFSVGNALTPLINMGQELFEPPDVAGWELGQSWFSTGAMLARMNFASTLAANQKFRLATAAAARAAARRRVVDFVLTRLTPISERRRTAISSSYAARGRRVDRIGRAAADKGAGPGAPDPRIGGVSVHVGEVKPA